MRTLSLKIIGKKCIVCFIARPLNSPLLYRSAWWFIGLRLFSNFLLKITKHSDSFSDSFWFIHSWEYKFQALIMKQFGVEWRFPIFYNKITYCCHVSTGFTPFSHGLLRKFGSELLLWQYYLKDLVPLPKNIKRNFTKFPE